MAIELGALDLPAISSIIRFPFPVTKLFLGALLALACAPDRPVCGGPAPTLSPHASTGLDSDAICIPTGPLVSALTSCRNWITFSPPPPFNPNAGIPATPETVRTALRQLFAEGFRGLVTYSLDPIQGLDVVPRLAKKAGFTKVIAGIYWFDSAQLAREKAAAVAQNQWIDGYVVGNEGLQFGRYTRSQLETEIANVAAATDRPVTTSEPTGQYLGDPSLLTLGDFAFPNIHPWWAEIRSPDAGAQFVDARVSELQELAVGRTIVVKEAWWPTGGSDPAATERNQNAFFGALAATPVWFVWGEAYDQFWKSEPGGVGPHWGFHTTTGAPKMVVFAQRRVYTGSY